jgi:hypothetical protein
MRESVQGRLTLSLTKHALNVPFHTQNTIITKAAIATMRDQECSDVAYRCGPSLSFAMYRKRSSVLRNALLLLRCALEQRRKAR